MSIKELVDWLQKHRITFYHFTDVRNIDSIKQHGLLSLRELKRLGIAIPAPGGNQWSHDEDERRDLDDYVHLGFTDNHPMEFAAKQEGRLEEVRYLRIAPQVALNDGVMFCNEVANKRGSVLIGWEDANSSFDWEVLYTRMDWRDPDIKARRKLVEKYELLIPKAVLVEHIRNI